MSEEISLPVKVSPRASRNAILGWQGEVLKVAVTAAADKGKANAALVKLLARTLGLPKSALRIVRGHGQRDKLLAIAADPAVLRRLPPH